MDPNLNAAARCITALRTAIDLRDIALLRVRMVSHAHRIVRAVTQRSKKLKPILTSRALPLQGALKFASTITFVDEEGVAIVRQATLTLSILEEHREQVRLEPAA